MANIEFEITAVVKAAPGDFPSTADCMAAIGKAGDDIVHQYGGRVIAVDSKPREVAVGGKTHIVTDRIVLVMKASGVLQR